MPTLKSLASGVISNDIDYVVAIAGGTPHSMRLAAPSGPYEIGDWEQYSPRIYSVVGHDELMAASGRLGAFYFFSRNDTCCFALASSDHFVAWLNSVDGMEGRTVRAFSDDQHTDHSVSPSGKVQIERYLMTVLVPDL